jgi:hypothetical protein
MQVNSDVLEIVETALENFQKLPNHENIETTLSEAIQLYAGSKSYEDLVHLCLIFNKIDIQKYGFLDSFRNSLFFKCSQWIHCFTCIEVEYIKILIGHENLCKLNQLMEYISKQLSSDIKDIIEFILIETKKTNKAEILIFFARQNLLNNKTFQSIVHLNCSGDSFKGFLILKKLDIQNSTLLFNILNLSDFDLFLKTLHHLCVILNPNNAIAIIEKILIYPEIASCLNYFVFEKHFEIQDLLKYLTPENQDDIKKIIRSGYFSICSKMDFSHFIHIAKLSEAQLSRLFSSKLIPKIQDKDFCDLLFKKPLNEFKCQQIIDCLSIFSSQKIFENKDFYMCLTQLVINYQKSFSLQHILSELAKNEVNSYDDLIYSFAFFENQRAIQENILEITQEELLSIPIKFQENFSEVRSNPSNMQALFNLSFDILQSSVESLPKNFQRLVQTHYMNCLVQTGSSPYFRAETLQILLQEKIDYQFAEQIQIIHEFSQLDSIQLIADFEQKNDLLYAPFFHEFIGLLSHFPSTNSVIRLCIRLYFMDVLNFDNHEKIFGILRQLNRKLSFIELKKAFFYIYHQTTHHFTIQDYFIIINENIQHLISFKKGKLAIQLDEFQICAQLFSKHPHLETILQVMTSIPDKILMNDTQFHLLVRILNHPSLFVLNNILAELKNDLHQAPMNYQGILEHPYPVVMNQILLEKGFNGFVNLYFDTRLQYLHQTGLYSGKDKDCLSRFVMEDRRQLQFFLIELIRNKKDILFIDDFDFLDWIKFCDQNNLIHFHNILAILSVSCPKLSLKWLKKLMQTKIFTQHEQFIFQLFIESNEPQHLLACTLLFENNGLYLNRDVFEQLSQSTELDKVSKLFDFLFLPQYFKSSFNYIGLLKKTISNPQLNHLHLILNKLTKFQHRDYISELTDKIIESKYLIEINELLDIKFFQSSHQDEEFYQNFFTMLDSSLFPQIVEIIKKASQKNLLVTNQQTEQINWIQAFIHHQKIEQLMSIIPIILEMNTTKENVIKNLQTLVSEPFDKLEQYLIHYHYLDQSMLDALNHPFYNYLGSKFRLNILISKGFIDITDELTQIQFLSIDHYIMIENIIEDFEKFHLFSSENQKSLFKKIVFHPRVEEIQHIESMLSNFKLNVQNPHLPRILNLILESPFPFNTSYLIGHLYDTKILYSLSDEYLSDIFLKKSSYELACFLSNESLFFKRLSTENAAFLFTICNNLGSTYDILDLFQYLIDRFKTKQPDKIIQLMLKLNSNQHLLLTLQKLEKYKLLNFKNINQLFSHPMIESIGLLINVFEQELAFNHEIFKVLLEDEYPHASVLLINYAQNFKICNQQFLKEMLELNKILFYSPALVDKFISIPKEFIQEINIRQMIHIAKILKDDPTEASEELLRFLNQLGIHSKSSQVTHLKSVHESSSETAKRLAKRYSSTKLDIYQLFKFLKSEILKIEGKTIESETALRCINKFLGIQYKDKIDKSSEISLQQFLAYCILAIQDQQVACGEFAERVKALSNGLYQIQRGYNQEINEEQDQSICDGGAFNKLNEVLIGIHPDFEQRVISLDYASIKFQRIAIHHAKLFLMQVEEPHDKKALESFIGLIHEIQTIGLSVIWNKIENKIAEEFFDIFSDLFLSQEAPSFKSFLLYGNEIDVKELNPFFQEQLDLKKKQYHYHRQSFFSTYKNTHPLIQHEFDKEYGLITFPT